MHILFHCTFYSLFYFIFYLFFILFLPIFIYILLCYVSSFILFFCTVHWADLSWPTFHYWLYPVWLCMWQIIKNLEPWTYLVQEEPHRIPLCRFWERLTGHKSSVRRESSTLKMEGSEICWAVRWRMVLFEMSNKCRDVVWKVVEKSFLVCLNNVTFLCNCILCTVNILV